MEVQPLAAALPFAVFALLALISWNRWLEPYVDSGRELMVPWRVSEGERSTETSSSITVRSLLRRGLRSPLRPVAPRSDGARGGDRAAADPRPPASRPPDAAGGPRRPRVSIAVAAAVFLRPGGWLFPSSFDAAIAVAAMTWALELAARAAPRSDALAGACLWAALCARLEMGLAAVAVLAFVVVHRREPRRLRRLALWPLAAAALAYVLVSAGIPLSTLEADGWLRLLDPPEAYRNVYRAYAGLDRPGLRLTELVLAGVVLLVVAALLAAAAAVSSRASSSARRSGLVFEAAAVAALAAVAFAAFVRPRGSPTASRSFRRSCESFRRSSSPRRPGDSSCACVGTILRALHHFNPLYAPFLFSR